MSEVGPKRGFGISTSGRMAFQEGKQHGQRHGGLKVARVCDMWPVVNGVEGGWGRGTRDEARKPSG